jgi:acetyltransferase-like isoleucine patch superfamily enzyme
MTDETQFKFKEVTDRQSIRRSAFSQYREMFYGDVSLGRVVLTEALFCLLGGLPGAAGLWLRSKLYRLVFPGLGHKVVFGRNVTIRHPHKIRIGDDTIVDDNCVIDAKGTTNEGISIGAHVYIGRNTIIYCKNGNLRIGDKVNISSNCQFVSSNDMTIGRDTVIGAYSYFLSGGGYDYGPDAPRFADQNGFLTSGPLVVGENCWVGTGVVILDAASVGAHCVIAAGAVVNKPLPANCVAGGLPAHVIKEIEPHHDRPPA